MEHIPKRVLLNDLDDQLNIQFNIVKSCMCRDEIDLNKLMVETAKYQATERLLTYFKNKKFDKGDN
tara:strand:- start:320 stop:517 length:198 start_codon:yes stop_codon:yes gene_type:complete